MTREQKIEWLANADTETLLRQYERCVINVSDPFETVRRDNRYTIESIFEDYDLVKSEVVKRMTGKN